MASKTHRRKKKKSRAFKKPHIGASPGHLVEDPEAPPAKIRVIAYNQERVEDRYISDPDEIPAILQAWDVAWIDVQGMRDVKTIQRVGDHLGIHKLALEDVVSGHQRAKTEEYPGMVYVAARMAVPGEVFDTEQINIFLGKNFLATFRDGGDDLLQPVRERIGNPSGRIRRNPVDYLAYAVIDAVVDAYFPVLEEIGERLDAMEDEILERPDSAVISRLHSIKRDLLNFRRAVWPMREAINQLIRDPSSMISDYTDIYLRDCYDHTSQVIDLIESYREVGSDLMSVYLSSISNKMNEVMKVLTVIATIFMPLSFLAGLYGMNFNTQISPWNMPELNWRLGYPFALGLIVIVTVGLLLYFRRKGWVGPGRKY